MGFNAANRIARRRTRITTALVAAGLLASACGSGGDATEQADEALDPDQAVEILEVDTGDDADVSVETDEALDGDVAGEELAMVETDSTASSTMGGMDEALAEISGCLQDQGADVGPLTLADMLTKAQGDVPADGDLVEIFAFFLDRDPTDAEFIAAVDACEDVVYAAPGIAAFLPPQQ